MTKQNVVATLTEAISTFNAALVEELDGQVIAGYSELIDNTPADIAARYWLMQLLEPLNRKELKSVVDGFLVQLLNQDQSTKLIKFLLIRFPAYFAEDATKPLAVDDGMGELVSKPEAKPAKTEEKPAEKK